MKGTLRIGDRVRIAETYHWARGATGVIVAPTSRAIQLVEGSENWINGYRVVTSLEGPLTFYWVEFDEAQIDADGDGPYQGGEIDARYLQALTAPFSDTQ